MCKHCTGQLKQVGETSKKETCLAAGVGSNGGQGLPGTSGPGLPKAVCPCMQIEGAALWAPRRSLCKLFWPVQEDSAMKDWNLICVRTQPIDGPVVSAEQGMDSTAPPSSSIHHTNLLPCPGCLFITCAPWRPLVGAGFPDCCPGMQGAVQHSSLARASRCCPTSPRAACCPAESLPPRCAQRGR